MGKVEVWCEWCRKPVLVAEAHISELEREKQMYKNALETSLTIANTTAANLHDVIRDKGKRIAELEKELYEWVGWAQTMLKVVKGNKIVHGSLGGELECAITSRIAELESELADKENWCTTIRNLGGKVSRLRECLKRLEWCDDRWVDNPGDQPLCPACAEPKIRGHASDCWLAKELKEGE
jgi:hypothetical protein